MEIQKFEIKENLYYYDNELLIVRENTQGYQRVEINKKSYRLHRLIALRYIENINNLPVVDHIDNDKKNNKIENLQWMTYSDNSKKAFREIPTMKNIHKIKGKFIISEKGNVKTEHKSLRDCAKFIGRDVSAVYRVLQGEWNLCNGYKLKYK